ncbi:MAG: ParB N-terminal domain-containing protein [Rhizonema sp. PD37]|nr:ParB N-terminal domain-containing protein [Rhizonema sp. PD37]
MLNISVADKSSAQTLASKKSDHLALDEIRRDGGTQPRAAINLQHVKLLEEQMEDGQQLEPVIVFYDGESYWLADGFHRWHAHRNREEEVITCVIHTGSRRDAVLYSVGANADHKPALPRSRDDKRRAVMTLLNDPEWHKWSDREIARRCCVSHDFVNRTRKSICHLMTDTKFNKERKAQRGGKTYTLDTTNIGRTPPDANLLIKDNLSLSQSGTISQSPNPNAVMVEQDNGTSQASVSLTVAHHLELAEGGLVEIHSPNNSKINGRLARIAAVYQNTVEVWVRDVGTMTMHRHTLKHQQVEPVPMDKEPQLVEVCDRITELRKCNLDPFEIQILLLLEQPVAFTPVELRYLAQIENDHGIVESSR